MNTLCKLLAAGVFGLALLIVSCQAHAVQKGPDGQCPPGTVDAPTECVEDPVDGGVVTVNGARPGLGWDYVWPSYAGSSTPVRDVEGGHSESGVAGVVEQELQTCEGNGKDDVSEVAGPGIQATGRPVLIATGTKTLPEGDIAPTGDGVALELIRLYSAGNTKIGAFGQTWSSSLDHTLVFEYDGLVCWAYLDRNEPCTPNGQPLLKIHAYNPSGYATHFSLVGGVWTSGDGDIVQLVGSEWIVSGESIQRGRQLSKCCIRHRNLSLDSF